MLNKRITTLQRRAVLCIGLALLLLNMTNLLEETLGVMRRSGTAEIPSENSSVPTGAFKMPDRNSSVPTGAFKMTGGNSSVPGAQAKDEPLPPCPENPPGLCE